MPFENEYGVSMREREDGKKVINVNGLQFTETEAERRIKEEGFEIHDKNIQASGDHPLYIVDS